MPVTHNLPASGQCPCVVSGSCAPMLPCVRSCRSLHLSVGECNGLSPRQGLCIRLPGESATPLFCLYAESCNGAQVHEQLGMVQGNQQKQGAPQLLGLALSRKTEKGFQSK